MRDPDSSDFCYYPFMQVLISAEGQYKVCSKHYDHITHNGKTLNTKDHTIKEAWESDYMKDIRQSFKENRRFPGCKECWRMQNMGLTSMRYHSYQYNVPDSQVENPVAPMRIETNSSNVCNLRCRICFATASTKWLQEAIDLYDYKENVHLNLHTDNLEQVKKWAGNLVELALFGGEPLLSEDNFLLIDYLIESGHSKHISLLFNTNATVFDESITERLPKFQKIRMSFSIDDLFERFEYQRKGASWDDALQNIRTAHAMMLELGKDKFDLKICVSTSLLNIYYLPELFAFFTKEFPELILYINFIYDPARFNIQILPPEIKEIIAERLESIDINPAWRAKEGELMEELLGYLHETTEMPFSEFFRLINRHDVYRKESFPEIFPEWWSVIKDHCPDDVIMGEAEADFRERTSDWLTSGEFERLLENTSDKIKADLNGDGHLHDAASIAFMTIFEDKRKVTEKIHLVELFQMIAQWIAGKYPGLTIPDTNPGWIKMYLECAAGFSNYNKTARSADDMIQWLALHSAKSGNVTKLLDDLVRTPANQLVRDLSRATSESLEADLRENYQYN